MEQDKPNVIGMFNMIKRYFRLVVYYLKVLLRNLVSGLFNSILKMPRLAELTIKVAELILFHAPVILRFSFLWKYIVRQKWQFALERAYHKKRKPRVSDPLFSCDFVPGHKCDKSEDYCSGFFNVDFVYNGLLVNGIVKSNNFKTVALFLDGKLIKKINLKRSDVYNSFKIKFMRNVVDRFPEESELTVKVDDGKHLKYKNFFGVKIIIPHGNSSLFKFIDSGVKISKKGTLTATIDETRERQNNYLEIYDKAKDFFDEEIGKPLFLMYGTLLGFYRSNDFIPGDDDFDGGYVSDEVKAKKVKEETKKIIIRLIQSGFTVVFNRRGRLFRLQLGRGGADKCHLDLRPLWFEGGYMWAHKQAKIKCTRNDFLPVKKGILRGQEVYIPHNSDVMLSGYYGPSWRVPDPGYVNDSSKIDKSVIRNLNRSLITPKEYFEICKILKIDKVNDIGMGRFVSTSLQNLYPLSEFIE